MTGNNEFFSGRIYLVAGLLVIWVVAIVGKIFVIQMINGDEYLKKIEREAVRVNIVEPKRGSLCADDGSLLATSLTRYEIRFDAVTVSNKVFQRNLEELSDSLSVFFGKSSKYYQKFLLNAKNIGKRYLLIAKQLKYSEYMRIKKFPIFRLGTYAGGIIVKERSYRDHPFGEYAMRTIGYDIKDKNNYHTRVGLEGGFSQYLRGQEGKRLEQKIGKKYWKPISDSNEADPVDGSDVVTTINLNIQEVTHNALAERLKKYRANHGCAIVMDVQTGEVKAISNIGITAKGEYKEIQNYAIWESYEPGSTFKVMTLAAALEDGLISISEKIQTGNGELKIYDDVVRDAKRGGFGTLTVSEVVEVSSNVGIAKISQKAYSKSPKKMIDRFSQMRIDKPIGVPILGETKPKIPSPNNKNWYGTTLAWMSFGYGVSLTPLQILAFYNAIANNGKWVKPRFIKHVRKNGKIEKSFDKSIESYQIMSSRTSDIIKKVLENTVSKPHSTGHRLYSDKVRLAGKTGTTQKNYSNKKELEYISSFVGFFPSDTPKYSCVVVVFNPDKKHGYYGADVSGPVFKTIAENVYKDPPQEIKILKGKIEKDNGLEKKYENYFTKLQKNYKRLPNVIGMEGMDAIALLENLGLKVTVKGGGKVIWQSIPKGSKMKKNQTIILKMS